jgi:hypothetical protein
MLGDARVHQPDVTRLTFDRIAENEWAEPGIPRDLRGGFESVLRCGNDAVRHVAKSDVAGLWRFGRRLSQVFQHGCRDFDPILLEYRDRRRRGGRIRYGRA